MAEMHRKMDSTSSDSGAAFTPFNTLGQSYDSPIGSWRVKAYIYRVITLIFLGIAFLLSLYFLIFCEMPREHVFAVQVLSTGISTGISSLTLASPKLLKKVGDLHDAKYSVPLSAPLNIGVGS